MTTRNVASVRKFFDNHFPERQIYHRSRGSVQFMTLTARAQIALLALTLGFLGWVAYASVNVVFKDQIITAKEQHFSAMQAAYEGRLAEMQAAYDELNVGLVKSQERFAAATKDLEDKHRQLSEIMARQEASMTSFQSVRTRVAEAQREQNQVSGGNRLVMSVTESEPTARHSKTIEEQAGDGPLVNGVVGLNDVRGLPKALASDAHQLERRLTTLDSAQREMVSEFEAMASRSVEELEGIIEVSGLNVERVLERVNEDAGGVGGPFIPVDEAASAAGGEESYEQSINALAVQVNRLVGLQAALTSIPLVAPLGSEAHQSSGFGPRLDPFTGRRAYHFGLDFVAPFKSPVRSTGEGVVTVAGRQGPYGNLVEIDHGNGFRTRYGHLYKINVEVGQKVSFRQVIGLLGSTGRSTGPHLHYEVRFAGTLRDPERFLEAGRHVQ